METKLIVNADDFGFTRGTNSGIVEAHLKGILTATTLMANGDAFDHAVELARATPTLDVGVHLVVWDEGPGPQQTSAFLRRAIAMSKRELAALFAQQVEKIVHAGIQPTHLDTHKHMHNLPHVMSAVRETAQRFGVAWVRRLLLPLGSAGQSTDHFLGFALTGKMNRETLAAELRRLKPGLTELMCHPAKYDDELEHAPTRLKEHRARELDALTAPEIRAQLAADGVQLTNYRFETSLLGRRPHP